MDPKEQQIYREVFGKSRQYPFANKPLGRDNSRGKDTNEIWGRNPTIKINLDDGSSTTVDTEDAPPSGQSCEKKLKGVLRAIEEREEKRRGRARDPENSAEKPRAEKQQRDVAPAATGEARAARIADDIRQLVLGSKLAGTKKSAMLSQLRLWTYFDSEEQQSPAGATEVLHTGRYRPVRSSDEFDKERTDDSDDEDYDEAAAQAGYDASVNYGR